jgi:hypothetical protein
VPVALFSSKKKTLPKKTLKILSKELLKPIIHSRKKNKVTSSFKKKVLENKTKEFY